jgi:DeoR/GlpR family transcriptional regulator of sugar metabolism
MPERPSRQEAILDLARQAGRVEVDALAARFEVSPQTIRKDLNDLGERQLLARVHGGAVLASGVENMGYAARRALAREEKRRIAVRAAALIPDHSSLFLNIGTTVEEVARALAGRRGLLVVTNNIHFVSILLPEPGVEVIVAGGPVRRADGGIVGEATVDLVAQFKLDFAVIGASALDPDGAGAGAGTGDGVARPAAGAGLRRRRPARARPRAGRGRLRWRASPSRVLAMPIGRTRARRRTGRCAPWISTGRMAAPMRCLGRRAAARPRC